MEVPPMVKKKSTNKKTNDEPTRWEHRLGRDAQSLEWYERSNNSLESSITWEEYEDAFEEEEEDDEATEDGNVHPITKTSRELLRLYSNPQRDPSSVSQVANLKCLPQSQP
ncbi:hypothetical protein PVK06_008543 [Gossypium arboreum]|uniref:Uncharacterized protein n=1 Tax=Gossypium arboreum TaxID=29729 RepID=A0ABR0QK60_GOSAR|nr:hypothetical protein PVK06_008543 [Gossypium arboreum]